MPVTGGLATVIARLFGFVSGETSLLPMFRSVVSQAQRRLLVCSGELPPRFFDAEFGRLAVAKLQLANREGFRIIFSKSHTAQNPSEALDALEKENKLMLERFKSETNSVENLEMVARVAMYWVPERPLYHFVVADDVILLSKANIAEPGKPEEKTRVFYVRRRTGMANYYARRFYALAESNRAQRLVTRSEAQRG